jgi:hypothetical protein
MMERIGKIYGLRRMNDLTAVPSALKQPLKSHTNWLAVGAFCAWTATVMFGGWQLVRYAAAATVSPRQVPAILPVGISTDARPHLIVFVHPHCPCTRATIANLDRLLARTNGKLDVTAVVVVPLGATSDWADTANVRAVRAIEGVETRTDWGGAEANRFGATTSGYVLLYTADRNLAYAGGITPARGHEGDCKGIDQILAIVAGGTAQLEIPQPQTAAGCALLDEGPSK